MIKKVILIVALSILDLYNISFATSGTVVKISESGNVAEINVGSKDGVVMGDEFVFYSHDNKKIAKGSVIKLDDNQCSVQINKLKEGYEIKSGIIARLEEPIKDDDSDPYRGYYPGEDIPSSGRSISACFCSCIFGPGAGEWAVLNSQSFGECCVEQLMGLIPIINILNWIGSMIDSFNGVQQPRANWLFTTIDL